MAIRRRDPDLQAAWLSDADVAALLGVHRSTVWRWADAELIPRPRRVGGRTIWVREHIEQFCKTQASNGRANRPSGPGATARQGV
jgi:predicted DNA-binding transcriptional regulator AlpA